MVCDEKQCSVVPVSHCVKPAAPIYRIIGDRIQTGCTDAPLTPFDLPSSRVP